MCCSWNLKVLKYFHNFSALINLISTNSISGHHFHTISDEQNNHFWWDLSTESHNKELNLSAKKFKQTINQIVNAVSASKKILINT